MMFGPARLDFLLLARDQQFLRLLTALHEQHDRRWLAILETAGAANARREERREKTSDTVAGSLGLELIAELSSHIGRLTCDLFSIDRRMPTLRSEI